MTAPITLFTGKPGAGKTAQLVAEIMKLRESEEGRPIFAMGINGLQEGLAADLTMDQLHTWWELPPGSIICIDECQEPHLMPKDRGNPADWVQRLAKVRHHGMSFYLTTQHPGNMSAFVRRLVGRHLHIARKFQSGVVQRFEWEGCADDPESRAARKLSVESVGTLAKEAFDKYKSSQLHTMKRRLPKKVYLFGALVVIAIVAAIAAPMVLKHAQQKNVALISGGGQGMDGQTSRASAADADQTMRRQDMAKWMKPRIEGLPWSAPMFDGMTVAAQPRVYCIASEDDCICNTEQGTRYTVAKGVCRVIATSGVYNPFLAPNRAEERAADTARPDQAQPPAGQYQEPASGIPGPIAERGTARDYTPPTYGEWNAEGAFDSGKG